jgi:hypothetical protein
MHARNAACCAPAVLLHMPKWRWSYPGARMFWRCVYMAIVKQTQNDMYIYMHINSCTCMHKYAYTYRTHSAFSLTLVYTEYTHTWLMNLLLSTSLLRLLTSLLRLLTSLLRLLLYNTYNFNLYLKSSSLLSFFLIELPYYWYLELLHRFQSYNVIMTRYSVLILRVCLTHCPTSVSGWVWKYIYVTVSKFPNIKVFRGHTLHGLSEASTSSTNVDATSSALVITISI